MATKKIRKIDEVNGQRVNHPHSAANIFYSIFAFMMVFSPLIYLFLPNIFLAPSANAFTYLSGLNGIDLFVDIFNLLKYLTTGVPAYCVNPFTSALCGVGYMGDILAPAVPILLIVLTFILLAIFVCSVILLVFFFINLIKGYLKHSKAIKVVSLIEFLFAFVYAMMLLVFHFGFNYGEMSKGGYTLNVWIPMFVFVFMLILFIFIAAIYHVNFKDSIPEDDLEIRDVRSAKDKKVREVVKVKQVASSSIPTNIENIGGHAFAENQSLVVANIPNNITKLGNSAFANCLNLKVVSLPREIKSIGYNCFFNCASLERITYAGSKDEFQKISRGSNWLLKAKTTQVVCIDGALIVNQRR